MTTTVPATQAELNAIFEKGTHQLDVAKALTEAADQIAAEAGLGKRAAEAARQAVLTHAQNVKQHGHALRAEAWRRFDERASAVQN